MGGICTLQANFSGVGRLSPVKLSQAFRKIYFVFGKFSHDKYDPELMSHNGYF